jgi:hypothetical protein
MGYFNIEDYEPVASQVGSFLEQTIMKMVAVETELDFTCQCRALHCQSNYLGW